MQSNMHDSTQEEKYQLQLQTLEEAVRPSLLTHASLAGVTAKILVGFLTMGWLTWHQTHWHQIGTNFLKGHG